MLPPANTPQVDDTAADDSPLRDYETFFVAQHTPLARLAYSLTGSRHDAQDLAQETLLRAFQRWEAVGTYSSPENWTRRVLINLVYSGTRRRRTEVAGLRRLRPTTDQPDATELSDAAAAFWHAVRTLPARQAQVVALHYGADLPAVEVAQILDIDAGTVRAHLHAARKRLCDVLDIDPGDSPAPTAPTRPGDLSSLTKGTRR